MQIITRASDQKPIILTGVSVNSMHHEIQSRNLDKNPDEVRNFTNAKVEFANLGEAAIGRITLEPGWKWSKDIKHLVNTNSCQLPHTICDIRKTAS